MAAGTLSLINNTLTNSPASPNCGSTISAFGQPPMPDPSPSRSREASTRAVERSHADGEQGLYCGAIHAHGSNRKIVVGDNTSVVNTDTEDEIPKACIGYDATFVIDDDPGDPFGEGHTDV